MPELRFQILEHARHADGGAELVATLVDALHGYGVDMADTAALCIVIAANDSAGLAELDAFLSSGSVAACSTVRLLLITSGNPTGNLTDQMRNLTPLLLTSSTVANAAATLLSTLLQKPPLNAEGSVEAKTTESSCLLRARNAMIASRITELEIVQKPLRAHDPTNRLTQDIELLRHCLAELDELLDG